MLTLRAACLFAVVPFGVMVIGMGCGWAEEPAMRALALSCPGSLPGPDCSRDTALDVLSQPAAASACPKVAQLLATHLDLPAGGYHKLVCERRRG